MGRYIRKFKETEDFKQFKINVLNQVKKLKPMQKLWFDIPYKIDQIQELIKEIERLNCATYVSSGSLAIQKLNKK